MNININNNSDSVSCTICKTTEGKIYSDYMCGSCLESNSFICYMAIINFDRN